MHRAAVRFSFFKYEKSSIPAACWKQLDVLIVIVINFFQSRKFFVRLKNVLKRVQSVNWSLFRYDKSTKQYYTFTSKKLSATPDNFKLRVHPKRSRGFYGTCEHIYSFLRLFGTSVLYCTHLRNEVWLIIMKYTEIWWNYNTLVAKLRKLGWRIMVGGGQNKLC